MIDAIPLFEVTEIGYAQNDDDSSSPEDLSMKAEYEKRAASRNCSSISESKKVKLRNDFYIRTLINGYNSGRVYYLKASNEIECGEIVRKLSESAKTARKAMEAKTRFEKSQERVRLIYHSALCQSIVALMIVVVRPQQHSPNQIPCCCPTSPTATPLLRILSNPTYQHDTSLPRAHLPVQSYAAHERPRVPV